MTAVVKFLYVNLLFTNSLLVTMAKNNNTHNDLKPMVTSGYRMFSSILAQHVVSIRALDKIKYHGDNHLCGGAIIGPKRILTAAHCIKTSLFGEIPAKYISVVAGSLLRVTPTGEEKTFGVSKTFVHPEYVTDPTYADIAYLILNETIQEVEDSIKITPLATKTPKAGTRCTALGWGRVFERGPLPDEILYVDIFIWNKTQCRTIHDNMREGVFCAGDLADRGKGTCHGDSGGPLFCGEHLAGIVSYGIGCGWSLVAVDFYTDVPYFLDWLKFGRSAHNASANAQYLLILILANFTMIRFISAYL